MQNEITLIIYLDIFIYNLDYINIILYNIVYTILSDSVNLCYIKYI